MEGIGEVTTKTIELFGRSITFQPNMLIMTFLIMGVLVIAGIITTRQLKIIPTRLQNFFEIIFDFLDDISVNTLGKKDGRTYLPLILTLFIFILFSNWIGIIPNLAKILGSFIAFFHSFIGGGAQIAFNSLTNITVNVSPDVWYNFLFHVPNFEEPTRNVNTDLAMALVVFIVVHFYGLKNKGLYKYFGDYMDPLPGKAPYIFFFWINPFFYLNIISNVSNVVSHSFRLFGNVFGGGMIIVIVSTLLKYALIPVGLFAFFSIFSGLVQAFVFTMLAVTYIAQQK